MTKEECIDSYSDILRDILSSYLIDRDVLAGLATDSDGQARAKVLGLEIADWAIRRISEALAKEVS